MSNFEQDLSPCSSLLSDDDFSYQLDVDNSLDNEDDDDDNDEIFHDAVPYEGDLDVFFDAFDNFDDYTTVDATGPFRWAYYTLMWQWMFTLFHWPFYMILFSLTCNFYSALSRFYWHLHFSGTHLSTTIAHHLFPLLALRLANLGAI